MNNQYTFKVYDLGPYMVNMYAVSLQELAIKLIASYPETYLGAWIECKELNFKGEFTELQ